MGPAAQERPKPARCIRWPEEAEKARTVLDEADDRDGHENGQGQRYTNEDVYQSNHGEIALKRHDGEVYLIVDDSIYVRMPIVDGLPPTVTYGLGYSPDGCGDLYAGTECGAWRWDRDREEWENIMSNVAPITIYWSVEAVQSA